MNKLRAWAAAVAAFWLLVAGLACGGPTDEDLLLDLVDRVCTYGEERDAPRILNWLADDYSDFRGRSKAETEEMLNGYFRRYRGIAINVLRSRVDELTAEEASVQADIAFSSGAAKVFRKLAKVSFDNYRLKLNLRNSGGDWLVTYAEWRPLEAGELF